MPGIEIPLDVLRLVEAFIFASPKPVTYRALQPLLPDYLQPLNVFLALRDHCAARGVVLVEVADGWTFRTAPDLAARLRDVLTEARKLPRVAMECLVIIAYNQPTTRADIEEIRGVSLAQGTLDVLLETGMIQPWGRRDAPGRPTLWVTTPRFLSQFGLSSVRDLPGVSLFPGPMLAASDQAAEPLGDRPEEP